jgi:hypothetical protein
VVDLVNESKKLVAESIAATARQMNPAITAEQSAAIAEL